MKKFDRLTRLVLFFFLLIIAAASTVYSGMDPPPPGAHWKGPAVLADIVLTDGSDQIPQHIKVDYTASCRGIEVSGNTFKPGVWDDIVNEDSLLYYEADIPGCEPPKDVSVHPMVSNVITFDDSLRHLGVIQAKVLLLYYVGKKK